jgi:DNA-directed RNA polymerase specialized sigma24 family protein
MLDKLYQHHDQLLEYAKIFDKSYYEDIVQETYLKLHQYSSEEKCFTNGKLNKGYIFIVIRSVYIKQFYNKFLTEEISDNITEEDFDYQYEIEWYNFTTKCKAEVDSWDMYDKKLFSIYRDNDISIRKLAKETGISFVSIFHSLKEHKKKLRELFQEDYNNLK